MTEAPRIASFSQGRKRYSRSVSGVGHQKSSRELFSRKATGTEKRIRDQGEGYPESLGVFSQSYTWDR